MRRHHEHRAGGILTSWKHQEKSQASGTFTFVSGPVFYFCFTMAFLIYGFLNKQTFPNGCSIWEQAQLSWQWLLLVAEHSSPNLFKLLHVLMLTTDRIR